VHQYIGDAVFPFLYVVHMY